MASRFPEHLAERLNGSPQYLGKIEATTTKNNADTATPFNATGDALAGKVLMLQPSADCYVLAGTSNAATVTADNGFYLGTHERVIITMQDDEGFLAVLAASGSVTLKVWELL